MLAVVSGSPQQDSRGAWLHSLSPAPQPAPVPWCNAHHGGGSLITSSAIPGGTQIVAAQPTSLRVGHFPSPHPGFPAFESASPQKYPFINNPAGVPLCTVPCPVPATFTTSSCPCYGRDSVLGWHHWQYKICPPVGSPQPGCTGTRRGWGRQGCLVAGPAHPAF